MGNIRDLYCKKLPVSNILKKNGHNQIFESELADEGRLVNYD